MANIAQTINVLQALIFTEGEQMVLTPTYHIYDMYQVHHDATLLPQTLEGPDYVLDSDSLAAISASASLDQEGRIHLSLVNIDPGKAIDMEIELKGKSSAKVTGQLLSAENMDSHNSFDNPGEVAPINFEDTHFKQGKLQLTIPARSVVVLQLD
jgi:alpha-N-arabinofuranosidase